MSLFYRILLSIAFVTVLFNCKKIKENKIEPDQSFVKVYDTDPALSRVSPLDIKQTSDGGYLTYAAINGNYVYLLKTDKEGNFMWEKSLPAPYTNPVGLLYPSSAGFRFFCMDNLALGSYAMNVNEVTGEVAEEKSFPDIIYPLTTQQLPDGGYLILNYNREVSRSSIFRLSSVLDVSWFRNYTTQIDITDQVVRQVTRLGTQYPFFAGSLEGSNLFYANMVYNSNLSLVFVDPSDGVVRGVLYGERFNAAVSAAENINGSRFAIARYDAAGEVYFLPTSDIAPTGTNVASNLLGARYMEVRPGSRTLVKKMNIGGKSLLIYAADARTNGILLTAFNQDGTLAGSLVVGQSNPYEIGNVLATRDGGLMLLTKTFVAGRFQRICLIKLSTQQIAKLAGQ